MGGQYIEFSCEGVDVSLVRFGREEHVEVFAIVVSPKGDGVAAVKISTADDIVDVTVSGTEQFKGVLKNLILPAVISVGVDGVKSFNDLNLN